jgi:hypothetical protein
MAITDWSFVKIALPVRRHPNKTKKVKNTFYKKLLPLARNNHRTIVPTPFSPSAGTTIMATFGLLSLPFLFG